MIKSPAPPLVQKQKKRPSHLIDSGLVAFATYGGQVRCQSEAVVFAIAGFEANATYGFMFHSFMRGRYLPLHAGAGVARVR